jgi:hypothetical protein
MCYYELALSIINLMGENAGHSLAEEKSISKRPKWKKKEQRTWLQFYSHMGGFLN